MPYFDPISTFIFLCVNDQPRDLLYTSCQSQLKNDYTLHEPDTETVNETKQIRPEESEKVSAVTD